MPAPSTGADLIALIDRAQLYQSARLDALRSRYPADGPAAGLAERLVRDGLLTPFQRDHLLEGRSRGLVLGDYRLLAKLGAGGAGQVYLAEPAAGGPRVAIKVLPPRQSESAEDRERFFRETRACATLDHPNIIKAFDSGGAAGVYYTVLELACGPDLGEYVRRHGPMPVGLACHAVRQAATALAYAHGLGMIHRDIKPANLLFAAGGAVKVADFGLVRALTSDDNPLTVAGGAVLGTADYLAPEQAMDSHHVDHRADVYSLGATLYYLLAGRAIFPRGSAAQKLIWHQTREPDPLEDARPDVPPEVAGLVRQMLAKRPEDRPASACQVADALSPWAVPPAGPAARSMTELTLADTPTSVNLPPASPPPAPRPAAPPTPPPAATGPSRRRTAVLVASSFLVGLAAVGVLSVPSGRPEEAEAAVAARDEFRGLLARPRLAPGESGPDEAGFVHDWLLAGPLPRGGLDHPAALDDTSNRTEPPVRPRAGDRYKVGDKSLVWRAHRAPTWDCQFQDAFPDLQAAECAGYAVCYVRPEADVPQARVMLGCDDLGKLWVDGAVRVVRREFGAVGMDQASGGPFALTADRFHQITVKVVNGEGWWGCAVRFLDEHGNPVTKLAVRLAPGGR